MVIRMNSFEQFMLLFNELKRHAGTPQRLVSFHDASAELKTAVARLRTWMRKTDFERRLLADKKIFQHVPGGFEESWTEYERDWAPALGHLLMRNIWPEESGTYDPTRRVHPSSDIEPDLVAPDPEHETSFDPMHHDGGAALQLGIDLWNDTYDMYVDEVDGNPPYEEEAQTSNICNIALEAYDYLTNTIGINIHAAFQRWQTLPPILMPSRVSNKYGNKKGSLNDLLDDAIRAFVCGAPAAAIAMCRAALELILKYHYLTEDSYKYKTKKGDWRDRGLANIIILAEKRYQFLTYYKLKNIKNTGDEVMHRYSEQQKLSADDERNIINYIRTLKFLIDKAPQ
jgi:hypothetical protein